MKFWRVLYCCITCLIFQDAGKKWNRSYSSTNLLLTCTRFLKMVVHCNPIQGQYRAGTGFSLCTLSHREKPVFITREPCSHCRDPVFITGISLWEKLHRENHVFITGNGFAVYIKSLGGSLFCRFYKIQFLWLIWYIGQKLLGILTKQNTQNQGFPIFSINTYRNCVKQMVVR